jgi:hypothetical protein
MRCADRALFVARGGKRISLRTVEHVLGLLGSASGLRVSPRTLRSTRTAALADAGVTLHAATRFLGHARPETLRPYATAVLEDPGTGLPRPSRTASPRQVTGAHRVLLPRRARRTVRHPPPPRPRSSTRSKPLARSPRLALPPGKGQNDPRGEDSALRLSFSPQFVLPLDQQSPEPSGVSEYHQFARKGGRTALFKNRSH